MRFFNLSLLPFVASLAQATPSSFPQDVPSRTLSARAGTISNPAIWEDYPDLDVFRVGNVFYYSSSTFAYSPGAPLLKSYDLINWAPVTHSVPYLNFGSQYNLTGSSRAYESGIWASTVRYRNSTDTWYWYGCVGFSVTYIWTAKGTGAGSNGGDVPDGKWNWQPAGTLNTCFYDCGLLIDNTDTMYIAYGSPKISVSQLSSDGLSIVKTQQVYSPSNTIEGSRMYQYNGKYYIFNDIPANAETVLMASSPFGPYTQKTLFSNVNGPISNAGYAHQGGMVDVGNGQYYFFAFMDSYPGGRIPVAAPLTFGSDGWPAVSLSGNTWPSTVSAPNIQTSKTVPSLLGTDSFNGPSLSAEWEWNASNPIQ
jgi:beta-xylosidase